MPSQTTLSKIAAKVGMHVALVKGFRDLCHRKDLADAEIVAIDGETVTIESTLTHRRFRLFSDSRGTCGWGKDAFELLPS